MNQLKLAVTGFVLAMACCGHASAQFLDRLSNPKVQVTQIHPPSLGLKINRIAFGPAKGDKADQVVDAITSQFIAGGIEVLDREHLQSTMAEHQLNSSGLIDAQTAMQLGKFLGSSAVVYINVQRAAMETRPQLVNTWVDYKKNQHVDHIAETQAHLKVSITTVDLTTGATKQSAVFEENPTRSNKITDSYGWPVPPSEYEVFDAAVHTVVVRASRLFIAWKETREVYFFDDNDCQMKAAYNLLKAGDMGGAAKLSLDSVELCKANTTLKANARDKALSHSLYNVGVTALLAGENEKALDYLRQSQAVKDSSITVETIGEVNKAMSLAAESRAVDARTAAAETARVASAPSPAAATPAVASKSGSGTGPAPAAAASKSVTKPPGTPETTKPQGAPAERLETLNDLLKQGILTQQEFDKKKADILKEL